MSKSDKIDKIRVLVIDDSPFVRKALLRIFDADPLIRVIGTASNGREGLEKALLLKPDVITLDVQMPEMDGLEVLKRIMDIQPTPVLMLSQFTKEGADLTLKALELGAMDFVDKSSKGYMSFSELATEILTKVKTIAIGKPIRVTDKKKPLYSTKGDRVVDVVAIGASTGGPQALQVLLPKFPKNINFGILIVQHISKGFTKSLAKRLNSLSAIDVKEATDGDRIVPGLALIAPSGIHMKLKKDSSSDQDILVRLDPEPKDSVHKPSVDVLFESVAKTFGARAIGVILTGMGSDGVEGLKRIKEKGGITIAQDEKTSVIFGMPKVAIERGVVDKVVSIDEMAKEILKRA
jgi:two-component system chemotaxis response regulator CheB